MAGLLSLLAAVASQAASLHPIFRDGMVFAAGKPIRVYGSGRGDVSVTFRGETRPAAADGDGWRVEFPPADPRGEETLAVAIDGRTRELKGVRVGEVFLMAGQSNLRVTLGECVNGREGWTDEPRLRCYTAPRPEKSPFAPADGWVPFTVEKASVWSALVTLLGRERLAAGAPAFGAVGCYQGASVIESWLPAEATASAGVAREKLHDDHANRWNAPGTLYRDTFRAIGPFSFTGVVWYQGESNTGSTEEAKAYEGWLRELVTRWRRDLEDENLRFAVVQIADFDPRRDEAWRAVQAAQAAVADDLAGVTLVRSADVCESTDIHPRDKSRLAHRLSTIFADGGRSASAAATGLADEVWPELDASDQAFYDAIYAPTVVARQPAHTHKEMVRLPDGEVRYYGSALVGNVWRDVYLSSRDRGLSWKRRLWDRKAELGPMAYCPWGDFYFSGNWYAKDGKCYLDFVRTERGPTDLATKRGQVFPIPNALDFARPMQPLALSRQLVLGGACSVQDPATGRSWARPSLLFSADDGKSWRATVITNCVTTGGTNVFFDLSRRWDNGCCESTLVELSTGEIWLACRATLRHHYLFKSKDGGRSWTGPEAMQGFYASNTMPTFLKLKDGRILFFWNNTEPLAKRAPSEYPELSDDERRGRWETVFTNRDALHVAISEDDGQTWIGFREVALSELRNREDFRVSGNDRVQEGDKSVHQTQPMEMPGGKILLPYGQGASRRICLFDVKWIYEKGRYDDFTKGTEGLSNHLFLKSMAGNRREPKGGHCAFNRVPGAGLVREPDATWATKRDCLQICRIRDERLVSDLQGVAWNFPAAQRGEVEIECRIDGAGFNLALCDRWINPGDEHVGDYAILSVPIEAETLGGAGRWVKCRLMWDWPTGRAQLVANGRKTSFAFSTTGFSPYGPSYLHLQTRAKGHDPKGAYFRFFRMAPR